MAMGGPDFSAIFHPLWDDIETSFPETRPLLAHYTKQEVLKHILENDEVWFSNPLFMNDLQEVRFGVEEGIRLVQSQVDDAAFKSAFRHNERVNIFKKAFEIQIKQFVHDQAFNLYVFCLSEHDPADTDGVLSMWRGYAANGSGAAFILNTANIEPMEHSALMLGKVEYATNSDRQLWLKNLIDKFIGLVSSNNISNDNLSVTADSLFDRIKTMAVFSKHIGFREEREWRVAYWQDRDLNDTFTPMFDYKIGPRGLEPVLKFQVKPHALIAGLDLSLRKITERIILGPSISSDLARLSFARMLDKIGKSELKDKVCASSIPFRSQ